MQLSQKNRETVDACRFCWMCRHICPIGNATGQERNTARARALSLSLVVRDGAEYTPDVIDNVYECALCGGCTQDCITGWDPVPFTKEARLAAALDGKMPVYVEKLMDNIEASGNIYGAKKLDKALADAIQKASKKSDTLFFLGEDARYKVPGQAVKAIEVLQKAGESVTILEDEPASGYSLDFLLGPAEETRQIMEKTAEQLNYKTIVCYDPADAKVFLREYREWNLPLKAEVITFTQYLAQLIAGGKLKLKQGKKELTPQDSPLLARDLEETQAVRDILAACGTVKEMLLNGKATMLAGNLIMNTYMPDVMRLVAEKRWKDVEGVEADTVVTCAPAEYFMMKETQPKGKKVMTVEEAVLACL